MNMNSVREQLARKLQDKEYRDAFVSEQIFSGLPLKIHALREQRHLSQKQLGEKAGVAQAWISKLEDPNYGKLTISTLLRLASAFDVGLEVDFVPFAKALEAAVNVSPEWFEVPSFVDDKGLRLTSGKFSRELGTNGRKRNWPPQQFFTARAPDVDEHYRVGAASRVIQIESRRAA